MILTSRIRKALYSLCLIYLTTPTGVHSSVLLTGNADPATNTTFTFALQAYAGTSAGENFYVGAQTSGTGQEYSLSQISRSNTQFTPLAPEHVSLNNGLVSINPLNNKGIALLSILAAPGDNFLGLTDRPIVVTVDAPANVYLIDSMKNGISMLSADNLKDANQAVTAGIVSVSATQGLPAAIFAAVKAAGGNFGDVGSGIALVNFGEQSINKVKLRFLEQIDAQNGGKTPARAIALDRTSSVVAIGGALAAMTNVVDIHWSQSLTRFYVIMQITAGAGGGRALVVGRVAPNGQITFEPIAPDAVFTGTNGIVGTFGAGTQVSLHKVRTMKTTTALDYVVVVGGNGAPAATQNTVYALPVASFFNRNKQIVNPVLHGTLANKNVAPTELFEEGTYKAFARREITTVATAPADIFTTDAVPGNIPAKVGGGALAAGNIDDIIVSGDTVFAVVSTPADATQLPGVFYSQAIFNNLGQIASWTSWQRVAGTAQAVFGAGYDTMLGNYTLMFENGGSVNTMRRTVWGYGDTQELGPLSFLLGSEFPKEKGGIQGLFDYPLNAPALNDISALIATGLDKIVLVETGRLNGSGAFVPNAGSAFIENKQVFTNGTLDANVNAQTVVISGGVLNEIGPVIAAEFAAGSGGSTGFLFAGGINGLAVLNNPDGSGWPLASQLTNNFTGLVNGMSFKKVGNYSFVRKLVCDKNFLYVLTDTVLDRLDLDTPGFPATRIAEAALLPGVSEKGALLDVIVSGNFALLGADNGLFRVGDSADISTATNQDDVAWTGVVVPQGAGPITQLITLSSTGRAQDVALGAGGLVYALRGYQTLAQVNRFAIAPTDVNPIDANTVLPLHDIPIKDVFSSFIFFGNYANHFATNGALNLHSRNRDLTIPPLVRSGLTRRNFVTLPLDLVNASTVVRLARESASGSWMVAGDFGLQLNE
jgi:hypothetical protein